MLVIIFTGLAILPALIICFGGLFLQRIIAKRTMVLAMCAGLIATGWELYRFYETAHAHIELRQWMIISDWMALFPLYSSLSVVIAALAVILAFENVKLSRTVQASMAIMLIAAVNVRMKAFDSSLRELYSNKQMLSQQLSQDEIKIIATTGSVKEKIVLATRSDLSIDVIRQLLNDPNEIVRFYGLVNPAIELTDLNFLKTNDKSAEIRKQASIEIKKRTEK